MRRVPGLKVFPNWRMSPLLFVDKTRTAIREKKAPKGAELAWKSEWQYSSTLVPTFSSAGQSPNVTVSPRLIGKDRSCGLDPNGR